MSDEQDINRRPLKIEDLLEIATLSGAALSADGRYIAYVTTKTIIEENAQKDYISVIELNTKQEIKAWEGSSPQWSPVANKIAYLAENNNDNFIWICFLDKDEKKPLTPIYESHYFMGHLSLKNFVWSPDGLHIAYASTSAFSTQNIEESNVKVIDRLLYKTKGGRGRPVVTDNELTHIWVMPVNGGSPQLLTDGLYNEHSICWSPNSSQIAFISNRSADPDNNQLHDLWSINVNTKNITRYTENFGTVHQPSWSPDGTSIAFLATTSKVSTNDSPA